MRAWTTLWGSVISSSNRDHPPILKTRAAFSIEIPTLHLPTMALHSTGSEGQKGCHQAGHQPEAASSSYATSTARSALVTLVNHIHWISMLKVVLSSARTATRPNISSQGYTEPKWPLWPLSVHLGTIWSRLRGFLHFDFFLVRFAGCGKRPRLVVPEWASNGLFESPSVSHGVNSKPHPGKSQQCRQHGVLQTFSLRV